MKSVIFTWMSFAEYLAHPAFGSSDLQAFKAGPPALVMWRRAHRDEGTEATRLGTAAHCLILTPGLFGDQYAVKPAGMEFRSKEAKEQRDAWLAAGKTIISAADMEKVREIRDAFREKHAASQSLRGAREIEASVFWECPETGLMCKGRPDWFDDHYVYDLKVSVAATRGIDNLPFAAHRNGWLNQLAHNAAGLREAGFNIRGGRLVVIAPEPPQAHRIWLLEVRQSDLEFLELDNANTRKAMAACVRNDHWPGTPESWSTIELPASAAFTESDLEGAQEVFDG